VPTGVTAEVAGVMLPVTVAVNVTDWPEVDGFGADMRLVSVGSV
jgi:hypothetical protein